MNQCPICHEKAKVSSAPFGKDSDIIECLRCGKFEISRSASASIDSLMGERNSPTDNIAKLSHYIRQTNGKAILHYKNIKNIIQDNLPTPKEQIDLLLRWIGDHTQIGEKLDITPQFDQSITGSRTTDAFEMIRTHLENTKLTQSSVKTIGPPTNTQGTFSVALTIEGWNKYHELKLGKASYKNAFMAMKFGDAELDKIVSDTFKPSVAQAGFFLKRLDDNPQAGLIDNRLRVEIQSSDFIIADLSHDNLGAYWEAGYAEGLGKPVIYTCEKEKFELSKTHFDTNHHLTIIWDKNNPTPAGQQLKDTIRATLPHSAKLSDD